jgi:hypothetical protein
VHPHHPVHGTATDPRHDLAASHAPPPPVHPFPILLVVAAAACRRVRSWRAVDDDGLWGSLSLCLARCGGRWCRCAACSTPGARRWSCRAITWWRSRRCDEPPTIRMTWRRACCVCARGCCGVCRVCVCVFLRILTCNSGAVVPEAGVLMAPSWRILSGWCQWPRAWRRASDDALARGSSCTYLPRLSLPATSHHPAATPPAAGCACSATYPPVLLPRRGCRHTHSCGHASLHTGWERGLACVALEKIRLQRDPEDLRRSRAAKPHPSRRLCESTARTARGTVIESRWVASPLAFAGELQPPRLNHLPRGDWGSPAPSGRPTPAGSPGPTLHSHTRVRTGKHTRTHGSAVDPSTLSNPRARGRQVVAHLRSCSCICEPGAGSAHPRCPPPARTPSPCAS